MTTFDSSAIFDSMMRESERAHLARTVVNGTFFQRCTALREFYARANFEIIKAGRCEWGIDPYEVNWVRVFTPIEAWLWSDIRRVDAVLYPQYPVGRFFVDFANPCARVAIECDGADYHQNADHDAMRQAEIVGMGWRMYRLTGKECREDFDESTMTPSRAMRLIKNIAEDYGIARNAR